MITKGYLLNVCHDERARFVLAVSDNLQELEDKINELTKADEEKKKRFTNTSNVREKYLTNFRKNVSCEDYHADEYETKEFVTNNPIPNEIEEFVKYSEDRNTGSLYFYSMRDFNVKYWITNIIGFIK